MNALPMLLGGPQRIGLDGIIDSRVLCCIRFVDTRVLTGVSGTFLNGETITVRRSGEVVATATIDAVLSSTKLALHGISATINTGDAISGNTSGATATASTGAVELVDVGPGKYTITNSGMTAGAVGTGRFTGDRSIVDPDAASNANVANAAFAAAKAMFVRIKMNTIAAAGAEILAKIAGSADWSRNCVYIADTRYSDTLVSVQACSYPTALTTPSYGIGATAAVSPRVGVGTWVDFYVNFTSGIEFSLNGLLVGRVAFSSLALGSAPNFHIGRWATSSATYSAAGDTFGDVVLFNQDVGIRGGFMPNTRYRYPQP